MRALVFRRSREFLYLGGVAFEMRDFDVYFLFSCIFVLFYCSCFTNIVGSLTMIVYLMFIHLIFCLFPCFCEFKFSFYLLDLYCIFHTCIYGLFSVF